MRTSRFYSPALLLIVLWSSRCGEGNTVTGPPSSSVEGINLEGAWTGRISYSPSADPRRSACGSEAIDALFTQAASRVSARIETACSSTLDLGGTLSGNTLTGTLTGGHPGDHFGGTFQAAVSASRISIAVNQTRDKELVTVAQIELWR